MRCKTRQPAPSCNQSASLFACAFEIFWRQTRHHLAVGAIAGLSLIRLRQCACWPRCHKCSNRVKHRQIPGAVVAGCCRYATSIWKRDHAWMTASAAAIPLHPSRHAAPLCCCCYYRCLAWKRSRIVLSRLHPRIRTRIHTRSLGLALVRLGRRDLSLMVMMMSRKRRRIPHPDSAE